MSQNGNDNRRQPSQDGVSRRVFVKAAAAGGAAVAAAGGVIGWASTRTAEEYNPVIASEVARADRVSGSLPRDPRDPSWLAATALDVPMLAQNMTTPRVLDVSIPIVKLRSIHNGTDIGFHLEWSDESRDEVEAIARFRDSVAVQFPVDPRLPTSVMMGQVGRPVHILHWRASWQAEMAVGRRTVRAAFPNAANDVTPEQMMGEDAARVFYPALYVGNAMAARRRTSAVEELVAEGYGTLTTQSQQQAEGLGVQTGAAWSVVIIRPLAGDKSKARLRPGEKTLVALAAWDGAAGNRGARKQWSNWMALELAS